MPLIDHDKNHEILNRNTIWSKLEHCRALTQLRTVQWLRWLVAGLSARRPGFPPWSVHAWFVLYKVSLGQFFLEALVSIDNTIPPWLTITPLTAAVQTHRLTPTTTKQQQYRGHVKKEMRCKLSVLQYPRVVIEQTLIKPSPPQLTIHSNHNMFRFY
jgi:hypothetical protein